METVLSQSIIRTALNTKIKSATKYFIRRGDQVRVYVEKRRKWDGTFTVKRVADNIKSFTH